MERSLPLSVLTQLLPGAEITGDPSTRFNQLAYDSRQVEPGSLFVAWKGFNHDGHNYIDEATRRGAAAVMVEQAVRSTVPTVRVTDGRLGLALTAAHFYDHPAKKLHLTGITGTNGKTTTTHMIQAILAAAGQKVGLVSSLVAGQLQDQAVNTTPESLPLIRHLHQLTRQGHQGAVLEVSSQALKLQRVAGCEFDLAVFTNLSRDHISPLEHDSWEDYRDSKAKLFRQLGSSYWGEPKGHPKRAIINADDPQASYFHSATSVPVISYGLKQAAAVTAKDLNLGPGGTSFCLQTPSGSQQVKLRLPGRYNIYNALAAAAAAYALDVDLETIAKSLNSVTVPGRFEPVDAGQPFTVTVDYAHNPDGLSQVLRTAQEYARGRLIVVFGAPGDRDQGKRPVMGRIASQLADLAIVTTDDPGSEQPEAIIEQITSGIAGSANTDTIPDRRQAIEHAIQQARKDDFVLIAGRGHETSQVLDGEEVAMDDRQIARQAIEQLE